MSDDEADTESERRRKRRALPSNFEVVGRQAQIEILADFEASDLPAFCLSNKTFAAQFCGSGDPDAVGLLDRDIVYEHWQVWLARDYGLSHNANQCAAFSPLERELVANSMQRAIDFSAPNMTNWRRLRELSRLYRRLVQSVSRQPIHNRQFSTYWGCRDGIAIVNSYYSWRRPQLWLVSIVDVLTQNDADPRQTTIAHIVLHEQRALFQVTAVKTPGSHTGLYLVQERRAQLPDDDDTSDEVDEDDAAEYQNDQSTLIFIHERRVITARLRVTPTLNSVLQGELWVDPLLPHLAYVHVWQRDDGDPTPGLSRLVTFMLDGTDKTMQQQATSTPQSSGGWMVSSSRLVGNLRAIRVLTGDELRQRNANIDIYTERFQIISTDSAYTYENDAGAWFFTSHAIFPPAFYTDVFDRIFVIPVVKAATAVQEERFRMRVVVVRMFTQRNRAILHQLISEIPLQITEIQFDSDGLTAAPARAIHFNDLSTPRVSVDWSVSEPMLFGRNWIVFLLEHVDAAFGDDSSDDSQEAEYEAAERPVSVAAFDFVRGVFKQTLNSDRSLRTTEILEDEITRSFTVRLPVYNNSLVGLNAARFTRSFGVRRKQLVDEVRAAARIENAKS